MDRLVVIVGTSGARPKLRREPGDCGASARWASAARPLYEAFSVSRVALRNEPGSTRRAARSAPWRSSARQPVPRRQCSAGNGKQQQATALCSNTPLCTRVRSAEEVMTPSANACRAGERDRGRKSRTAKRRSSALYPVGPDQDPGQDAVYGTGDLSTCERTGPIYKDGVLQPGASTVTRPSRYASHGPAYPPYVDLSRAPSGSRPAVR